VGDLQAIDDRLRSLCERVCWRARQRHIFARTITLKLRYTNFETLTRAHTIKATNAEIRVLSCVKELFRDNYDGKREVRLLGIALSGLEEAPGQLELPFDQGARPPMEKAIDACASDDPPRAGRSVGGAPDSDPLNSLYVGRIVKSRFGGETSTYERFYK
jgi:DNA polymerase-4